MAYSRSPFLETRERMERERDWIERLERETGKRDWRQRRERERD